MTNAVIGSVAQGQTDYNLVQAAQSEELTVEILQYNALLSDLKKYGIINTEADSIVGDTVNFYNLNRVDSNGMSESADAYSNADDSTYGQRQLVMDAVNYSRKIQRAKTMTQIRANTSVGKLTNGVKDTIISWGRGTVLGGVFNHLAANTANSITRYDLAQNPYVGSTLKNITGLNTVEAMNDEYSFYGNDSAGAPANPSEITENNYATLVDFINIENSLFDVVRGRTSFNQMDMSHGCKALVIIGRSNWGQMLISSPAQGNIPSVARETYESISATGVDKSKDSGMKIGGFPVHTSAFTPDLKYLVVDDYLLPRAVHNGAEVANTRTCLIIGKHALDMKVGSMMPSIGNENAAFAFTADTEYEKLNTFDYYQLAMKFGVKRVMIEGTGINAGTRYNHAAAVLNLYSAK